MPWSLTSRWTEPFHGDFRVPRKPNYGFEKRRKELERKQKQEAKLQRRAEEAKERAEEQERGGGAALPADDITP